MNRTDTMQAAVQRYLDERHRLGFSLKSPGTELTFMNPGRRPG